VAPTVHSFSAELEPLTLIEKFPGAYPGLLESGAGMAAASSGSRFDILPMAKANGANFGWSAYEGNAPLKANVPKNRTVLPTLAYPHSQGCAVTGGYIVRDPRLAHIFGRKRVVENTDNCVHGVVPSM
jgi:hypothetical protein